MVGNIDSARRNRHCRSHLLLEGFEQEFLQRASLFRAESFVGGMCKLLCLEADASMKLDFEPLAADWFNPLAIESLILIIRPVILRYVQPITMLLQSNDVRTDALCVAS